MTKMPAAIPSWIATSGQSPQPFAHHQSGAPAAIATFSQLGMVRLWRSPQAARISAIASNAAIR